MIALIILLSLLWNDPSVNQENRLPMYASFDCEGKSLSLDGDWKFQGYQNPEIRVEDFWEPDFDDSGWETMPVPGMWEMNGFGDPVYICNNYAWRGHYVNNPPFPPIKDNHIGQYRRSFTWSGGDAEDVILSIGAVTSNVRVWLNGMYVGYSEDSKLAAEFDITDKLREGDNLLALEVFRWCDGTYLEDQDFWRMSGISRSVNLIRKPKTRLEDLHILSSASGLLDLNLYFKGEVGEVAIKLRSPRGKCLRWKYPVQGDSLHVQRQIASPMLWSAETPNLYSMEIMVRNAEGTQTQLAKTVVGFRDVEVRGNYLLVNGKAVYIKGINRHEMTPYRGYCISREEMLEDVRQLKLLNLNAVRTSHYPNDPYWYELCDRYGIYVMDEANIESHGVGYKPDVTLADKAQWALPHRERFQRMLQRDRNHPCVIMWSLGNEAGDGRNHADNYSWAKAVDPSRPVVYQILKTENRELPYTDIEFYHYRSPEFIKEYLTDGKQWRPFMLQEYAHAMGNSLGNFKEYWDLVRQDRGFQGGFIWDFADQALIVRDSVKLGGDFNDYDPWNVSLHCNGLLSATREWHPHAWEAKYQMRNILMSGSCDELLKGRVHVWSEFFFKTLRRARLKWSVLVDGETVMEGARKLSIDPHKEQCLRLGYTERALRRKCPDLAAHDVRLQLFVYLGKDDGVLKKGDLIAWEDLPICMAEHPVIPVRGTSPENALVVFDDMGFPVRWTAGGVDFLSGRICPCFGRAITENDKGAHLDEIMKPWLYPEWELLDISAEGNMLRTENGWECSGEGTLKCSYRIPEAGVVEMTWTLSSDGDLRLKEHLTRVPDAPPVFRVGVEFAMPGSFSTLDFHGAGPFETYSDRKSAARIAHYTQSVTEQYHAGFVRPQESGNHTDLRYMSLVNAAGDRLLMHSDTCFSGSALPYSRESMDISVQEPGSIHHPEPLTWRKHFHSQDLVPDGLTYVHADLAQMGLGGIDSWKSLPLDEYMLDASEYTFSLTLTPELRPL